MVTNAPTPATYAKTKCKHCHGKGIVRVDTMNGAPVMPTLCSCAKTRYKACIEKRAQTKCPVCDKTGYCDHRPRTLRALLEAYHG